MVSRYDSSHRHSGGWQVGRPAAVRAVAPWARPHRSACPPPLPMVGLALCIAAAWRQELFSSE
eukprot:6529344-Pyramimonas_sp.AAC.1